MAGKENNEFDSLFDEMAVEVPQSVESKAELFDFDDGIPSEKEEEQITPPNGSVAEHTPETRHEEMPGQKRRSSEDFSRDMDALLLTAQSSMIIDGMRGLTKKDFSTATLQVYLEAVKGVDLIIKILARNPGSYYKLSKIIDNDMDCKEVETLAFQIYHKKHKEAPDDDEKKLKAFEEMKFMLVTAYNKSLISSSIASNKKYFLLSGNLDQDKLTQQAMSNNAVLRADVARFRHHLKIAIDLLKRGDYEIGTGLRGKDVSIFIIKTSQLLSYYYLVTGNAEGEKYYRRMHETYKKYFIVR